MAAVSDDAPRPRRTWPQRLVLALGVILVLSCVAGAVGAAYGVWKFDQVEKYDIDLPDAASGAPRNYLVIGSDSRAVVDADQPDADRFLNGESGGRRSDTILVVRVDPRRETATMLSLPRDLWVPISGTGTRQRINTAYAMGKQVLADTVQQYLGIPVHHYVEVDFRGFQGLVKAIDGVPMYFERAMRDPYSGLDVLHPGCVNLDADQALAFARARHLEFIRDGVWRSDPTGDLGRITRQQIFIRRAISRAVGKGASNPLTLKRLVDVGVANVGIDKRLSPRDLLALARRFSSFSGEELKTYTLPVVERTTDGGADVLQLDERAAVPTLDLFRDRPGSAPPGTSPAKPVEGAVDVQVLNGSGVDKQAANAAGALQAAGFRIAGTGNAGDLGLDDVDRTEVRYAAGEGPSAELVARHLTAGADLVEDDDLRAGAVVLVAGRDFTTVEAAALDAVPGAEGERRDDTTSSTSKPTTTSPPTTEPVGRTPGEPPPGTSCG